MDLRAYSLNIHVSKTITVFCLGNVFCPQILILSLCFIRKTIHDSCRVGLLQTMSCFPPMKADDFYATHFDSQSVALVSNVVLAYVTQFVFC